MNIFEVIAEADTKPKVVKDLSTGKFTVQMPDGRRVGSYSSQKAATDDMIKRPAIFNKVPKTPAQATAQTARVIRKKSTRKIIDLLQSRTNQPEWQKLGRYNAAKKVGRWLKLLVFFGYGEMIYDYWSQMAQLDDMYEKEYGTKDFQKDDKYYYIQGRLLSILSVQIAASGLVTRIVRYVVGLKWLFRALGLGATIGTGGFGAGAAVAGVLASEAVLIAVQTYLNKPENRDAIAKVIAYEVGGESGIPGTGYQPLTVPGEAAAKYYNKLKDGISDVIDDVLGKKKTQKPTTGQGPQPEPSQQTTTGQRTDKPNAPPSPGGQGRYSQYTTDPELKAALQAQGL